MPHPRVVARLRQPGSADGHRRDVEHGPGWELGLRLRERREQLGLTATVVGKTTRIGGTNLSAIEGGKQTRPR
ncbi:MAG: helix-turn-helix domain-containing protein [Pseudonocardiaceae bacterium]